MNLFAQTSMLWLLLFLLLPLCAFLIWTWRTKQKLIATFVQSRLLSNLTVGVSQSRQQFRLVLLAITVLFLILAMARPQWGFSWEETKQQGLDIVVAIDTSRSMLAEDLAPNRLTRAKLAALDLMRLAKNDRLGLVAFAGTAFLQCPLTLDEEAFRQNVEALSIRVIPQGGTAMTEAIQSALTAFEKGNDNHKVLVLFTDGEDHDQKAIAAAKKAAEDGLKIFTIGVGTSEGELIRISNEQGATDYLKDNAGNVVKSRLNETLLQQIATAANGFYLPLRGAKPMEALYAQGLAPLPKSDSTTKLVRQFRERFHWPLGIAIVLLVLEMFLPQRKRIPQTNRLRAKTEAPVAALVLMLGIFSVNASPSSALREYDAGNFHSALDEFKKLSQQKTNELRLSYNAGTAAFRAKQFDDAQKFFGQATTSPDLQLQQRAYYNLGNTFFEVGEQAPELDKKQKAWETAAQNFQSSLKLNPQDGDAKNNLDLVRKMLEELKKQQQQQKSEKDQEKNEDKENKDEKSKDSQQQEKDKDSQSPDKDSEKKDESQKEDSEKQSPEQKEDSPQQQAKEEQSKQQGQPSEGEKDKNSPQEGQEAQALAEGKMTPEQAHRFLDAQKQDDQALIFQPKSQPKPTLKDW